MKRRKYNEDISTRLDSENPEPTFFSKCADYFVENIVMPIVYFFGCGIRMISPAFAAALYYLVYLHVDAYFKYEVPVFRTRTGPFLGIIWVIIGLTILYNICFNHLMAMIIKPGSPTDLVRIEKMIKENNH